MILANDFNTLFSVVYTAMIIGFGYMTLWVKFKFVNSDSWIAILKKDKKTEFYGMGSYDKAMQSLLAGIVIVSINCFVLQIPFEILFDIKTFLESGAWIGFIIFQILYAIGMGFIWAFLELRVIRRKDTLTNPSWK